MRAIERRRFLQGAGAAGTVVWASPWLARLGLATDEPAAFPQGVASGDPTQDAVILWTRYQGPGSTIHWKVYADEAKSTLVTQGSAGPGGDGTVKVDVTGLDPATTYWYQFERGSDASALGRTRTAPDDPTSLRFAVASCQDFQAGYYLAWDHIAARDDIDFVLFLGDTIYEYADNGDGFRIHDPLGEIFTLSDYRRRYRNYRTDAALRAAHRRHPFICVWDDHEVANDRWGAADGVGCGGAENHQAGEGEYCDRLAAAEQAYFEYMPIRPSAKPIYRQFTFGSLADLFALDTRSYRNEPKGAFVNPVPNIIEPAFNDPNRTILGADQKTAFKDWLAAPGGGQWKLVGNQVMIGSLNFASIPDPAAAGLAELFGIPPRDGIPVNHDQWDGYQVERREILDHIKASTAGDVVFLTGDIHTSWVHEVTTNPAHAPVEDPVAVEFVGPSITSDNLNELVASQAGLPEPLPHRSSAPVEAAAIAANRQLRYVELDSNGYVLVDVNADRVLSEYHLVVAPLGSTAQPIRDPNSTLQVPLNGRWMAQAGSARLLPAPSV